VRLYKILYEVYDPDSNKVIAKRREWKLVTKMGEYRDKKLCNILKKVFKNHGELYGKLNVPEELWKYFHSDRNDFNFTDAGFLEFVKAVDVSVFDDEDEAVVKAIKRWKEGYDIERILQKYIQKRYEIRRREERII